MINKKSQSQVISTVLLILITIAAVTILIGFVIPFVNNQLERGDCFKVIDEIEFSRSSQYTCFDSNKMIVQVKVKNNESLEGFYIELRDSGSKSYKITKGASLTEVVMYSGGNIEIPKKNEAKTYNISSANKPDSIHVSPILEGGQICDVSDSISSISDC